MYDGEGIGPDSWGPHGWKFIHFTALGYPDEPTNKDKMKYKKFYTSLCDVIPCIMCRNNYVDHLKEFPITNQVLKDKESLMGWTVKIHNIVNKSNNKRVVPIKEGIEMIKKNYQGCQVEKFSNTKKVNKIVYTMPIIIFGLILIYQLIKIYCKSEKKIINFD